MMAVMEIIHIGGDGVARSSGEFSLDKSEADGIGPRHNGKANPMTVQTLASEAAGHFETFQRNTADDREDPKDLWRRKDGAPKWVEELVEAAHGDPTMLPDDWRYECIKAALDHIAEHGDRDDKNGLDEFADGQVPTYNHERIEWLGSHGFRPGYVDEAAEEGLVAADVNIIKQIGAGMRREAEEVYYEVIAFLRERDEESEAA
jgi:hypothetical protein